jgi:chemotaxis protein MotB
MAAGGGAWKVAYADFVTAMMAFFLVMWLTTQEPEVKQAVAGYFADPWGTAAEESAQLLEVQSQVTTDRPGVEVAGRPTSDPESDSRPKETGVPGSKSNSQWIRGYRLRVLQEGDRLPPVATVPFDGGSAELSEDGKRLLDESVEGMVGKSNRMEIRAHSSRRPLPIDSPYQDHWELGFARAQAVMRYLVECGIDQERMRLSQSASYEPLVDDYDTNSHRGNSRVEIYLMSEYVTRRPGSEAAENHDTGPKVPDSDKLISTSPVEHRSWDDAP